MKILTTLNSFLLIIVYVILSGCSENNNVTEPIDTGEHRVTLQIFYTNDEHGWFEPSEANNGAAGMMTMWKTNHNYTLDGINLVLSGGDMWTGPAISTWFQGRSMAEVMKEMGYDAAALGNHEFDFTQDGLRANLAVQGFPILAANIKSTVTGTYPDFVQPYLITVRGGIKIGIIGLTTMSTIEINFPQNVQNLELISYTEALDEIVPVVKNQGAELLILITHAPQSDMINIRSIIKDHDIAVVGCGHNHAQYIELEDDFTVFETSANMLRYAYVEVEYDTLSNTMTRLSSELFSNEPSYSSDLNIMNTVSTWQQQRDDQLADVIGYTATGVSRNSAQMYNMITDSWLVTFTDADIALSNFGGVRQGIPVGDITLGTIVGILPFENNIIKLELTGMQIRNTIASIGLYVGGMNVLNNYQMNDGSTLNDNTIYKVLITDYIYYTDESLQQYDSTPDLTNMNWRDPVINWIRSLNTTSSDPLENYLDGISRQYFDSDIFLFPFY